MNFKEVLKRTDEDEELWFTAYPTPWSRFGPYFLAERREGVIRCNADSSVQGRSKSAWPEPKMFAGRWRLLRVQNGRWMWVE